MIDFCSTTCLSFLIILNQFCTQSSFGNNGTYIYCVLEWNWKLSIMIGACVKFFKEFRVTTLSEKWTFQLDCLFKNLVLKNLGSVFGFHTDSSIRIYNTVSFSNLGTMTVVQWLSHVIQHTYWETFTWNFSNWNGVNVQWIYSGSISDSNIWCD